MSRRISPLASVLLGIAVLVLTLHVVVMLLLMISFRGCPDECHAYGVGVVFATVVLAALAAGFGGAGALWWLRQGHSCNDLRPLRLLLIAVSALLGALGVSAATGLLENAIEGLTGISLQPTWWETFGAGTRDVAWITLPEIAAVGYALGASAIAFLGAWLIGRLVDRAGHPIVQAHCRSDPRSFPRWL